MPSSKASGAMSTPFGQTTVCVSTSIVALAKNETSRSGSKTGPTGRANFGPKSSSCTVPSHSRDGACAAEVLDGSDVVGSAHGSGSMVAVPSFIRARLHGRRSIR